MAQDTSTGGAGPGAGHLARWASHRAMVATAEHVADKLEKAGVGDGATVLLVEDRDLLGRDWAYGFVTGELARRRAELAATSASVRVALEALAASGTADRRESPAATSRTAAAEDAEGGGSSGGSSAGASRSPVTALAEDLGGLGDVVDALRTRVDVSSHSLDAVTAPLTVAVADRLLRRGRAVVVDAFQLLDGGASPVATALDATASAAAQLRAGRAQLAGALDRAEADALPAVELSRARAVLAEAGAALDGWAGALATLVATPEGGGRPLLVAAAVAAASRQGGVTHVVALSLDTVGTDVVVRRTLVGPNGRVLLVGGVTASWLLLRTADGVLVRGGTHVATRRIAYDLASGEYRDETTPDRRLPLSLGDVVQGAVVVLVGLAAMGWFVVDALVKAGALG